MEKVVSFLASRIIAGDEMDILKDHAVNVSEGKILSISPSPLGDEVVDLENSLLSPMFINAHCHLGDTGAKELGTGLPLAQVVNPPDGLKHKFLDKTDQEELTQQMKHGLREMLRNGIIACADFREQGLTGVKILKKSVFKCPIK